MGYVAGMVALFMLLAFRSAVIALKAVLSIGMTLSIVFGVTRLAYQDLDPDGAGVCYIPPIVTFPMVIGFGLVRGPWHRVPLLLVSRGIFARGVTGVKRRRGEGKKRKKETGVSPVPAQRREG